MEISKNKNVIVVDDDSSIRIVISTALTRAGFNVRSSGTAAGMWRLVETGFADVLITDVGLPDADALDILPKLQKMKPNIKIIVMSARSTLLTAVRAEKKGAFYYLPKPFDLDELLNLVTQTKYKSSVVKPFNETDDIKMNKYDSGPIIGKSAVMQEIYKVMSRLVSNNLSVLISGESGTGKKTIAESIHNLSYSNNKPFINLDLDFFNKHTNFLDIKKNLVINNYISPSIENIEELNGCTIFINDVADLSADQQSNFIVFLEKNFIELSKNNLNFKKPRIITCTKQNVFDLVNQGLFREDLYYRINIVPIKMPALRNKIEDINDLSLFFLKLINNENYSKKFLSPNGMVLLKKYLWPGNIRELKNVVERLCLLSSTNEIPNSLISKVISEDNHSTINNEMDDIKIFFKKYIKSYLQDFDINKDTKNLHGHFIPKVEKPLIEIILELFRGNQIKTAECLGFNRNTLRKKIKLYDIEVIKKRKFL